MQSIIGTIAELSRASDVVNNEDTDDATADKNMAIVYEKEDKLCRILKRLNGRAEKPDDDERLAIYEVLFDPNDPPKFADKFKTRLYGLIHSF